MTKVLTEEEHAEFLVALRILASKAEDNTSEPEYDHIKADQLICKMLEQMGYRDIVEMYNRIPKWYS